MSRPPRGALLVVAVAGTLACGGCHGAAAPSATGTAPAVGSADPDAGLSSVESTLDAIERQLDRDGAG